MNSNLPSNFRININNQYGPGTNLLFRKFEKLQQNIARESGHIRFLTKCRDAGIVPKGLQLKSPIQNSSRILKIIEESNKKLVRERISFHRWRKYSLIEESKRLTQDIYHIIPSQHCTPLFNKIKFETSKYFHKLENKHINKFNTLLDLKTKYNYNTPTQNNTNLNNTVINKSNYILSNNEINILQKGLNYSITPKTIPVTQIISSIEDTLQHISDTEKQDEIRWKTRSILMKNRKLKQNLKPTDLKTLKKLKNNKNIVILPADKGNATVVLEKTDYDDKITEVLRKGSYKKLKKDPTTSIERKIYNLLKKNEDHFDNRTRTKLTPHYSKPPHLYGLPKIHKENYPLRPIISSRGNPSYNLAKYLLPILNPLVGKSESFVRNSAHFINLCKSFRISSMDRMVSFDVESLFTNVPIEESLMIIKEKLEEDDILHERTDLPISSIMELLTCCLRTTYFQVENDFYEQTDGMPMGSPLSPVVANLYMEFFEEMALGNYNNKPTTWIRYVDDTFAIIKDEKDNINSFLKHINSLRPSIKFTMEQENNKQISFLDILIKRNNNDDSLTTTVYRKPTNTGRYLNYKSNHPYCTKLGVARNLINRARSICSSNDLLKEEIVNIEKCLRNNNYPRHIIKKSLIEKPHMERDPPLASLVIPYINGVSENIMRIMLKYNIVTRFTCTNTIRSAIVNTKPKSYVDKKNCIYKIPCTCGARYIGETKRPLEVRIKEHHSNTIKGETSKSKIAQHAWENQHHFKWNDATILKKETNTFRRKFLEAAFMLCNDNIISQASVEIKPVWNGLLKEDSSVKLK